MFALGFLLMLPSGWAAEVLEVFAAADTTLLEFEPDFNLGGQTDLPSGTLGSLAGTTRSRLLIRFDLSALPESAVIQSAVFRCRVVKEPADPVESIFALHRMLKPWSEGRGSGSPPGGSLAQPGETTWNERVAGTSAWADPGGYADEDFVARPSAGERVQGLASYDLEIGAVGLQDLQNWLTDPGSNHGWMLISESEELPRTARRFASREAALDPPRLSLSYLTPPPAPSVGDLTVSSNEIVLGFEAEPNVPYVWEESPSLAPGTWNFVLDIPPILSGGFLSVTNPVGPSDVGFIRLRVGP